MTLRIAFLDDEPAICEMFRDNFEKDGVQISTYTDPQDFMTAIEASKPDLVFLDYRLPRTNGDIIAGRLNPNLKLVLMTGDVDVAVRNKFVKIFHKPFEMRVIGQFIDEFASEQILTRS